MKKSIKKILIFTFLFFVFSAGYASAADRYWVGGTGNFNDTTHWSATSGGAGSAGVPTSADNCYFNSLSHTTNYTVTVNVVSYCLDIIGTAPASGNMTLAGSQVLHVYGSMSLYNGMIMGTGGGTFYFDATSGSHTVYQPNSKVTYGGTLAFGTSGGGATWTLTSDITLHPNYSFYHQGGTLNLGSNTITCADWSSTTTTTRVLNMDSATIIMQYTTADWNISGSGYTVNAGTSTIKYTSTTANTKRFDGGGQTYYNVWYSTGSSTATLIVTGSNTFNDFKDDGTGTHTIQFTTGTTQTFSSFTVSGTAGHLISINSTTTGTHALVKSGGGTINSDYLNIQHSVATPASTWYAGTHSTNNQATSTAGSGWIFTAAPLINISGTTNGNDGTVVKVAVNGTVQAQSAIMSGGIWSITNVTEPTSNDIITVWSDGVVDSLESTAVTKWSSGNITGMVLNANILTIGSNQNTSISATDLDQYDCGADEDVMHIVTSGALSIEGGSGGCAGGVSNSYAGDTLSILANNTLTISSSTSESVVTELLNNAGTITSIGTPTIVLNGTSGTLLTNSGTFTQDMSNIELSGNGDATINSSAITLYDLTISGTGIKSTHSSNAITFDTNGTLTVSGGTFDPVLAPIATGSNVLTVNSGSIRVNGSTFQESYPIGFGTVNLNTGSNVDYVFNGTQTVSSTISPYYNLTISNTGTKTLENNITVSNIMTIGLDATLDASSYSLTLSGTTGTPFIQSGTFIPGTGTVIYTGNYSSGNTNIAPGSYNNLTINNGSETFDIGSNSGFLYYRTITIDHTKVPNTDQTDFPILISGTYSYLATILNGGKVTDSNGYDIGFYSDPALTTKLSWEREKYDPTTGEIIYWVKIPSLSSSANTTIYMGYGNSSITTDQSDPTNVWDSSFKGVWHLPDGTTLGALDSTSNSLNGTISGATATTGQIDGGANFVSSSNQYIDTGNNTLGATNVTIDLWAYSDNFTQNGILVNKGTVNTQWLMFFEGSYLNLRGGGSTNSLTTSNPSNSNWHHVVGTITGTTGTIYVDGTQVATGTVDAVTDTSNTIQMGRFNSGYYFDGKLDEIRISNAVRSADWISTEYNNQSSPSTFYSIGYENNYGLIINGNLTISAGTLDVTASNYGINLIGNWDNSGLFIAQSGSVTLSGTSSQSIVGSTDFYNLYKIGNNTISLTDTLNVTNGLFISSGTLDTALGSNNTINVGSITINGGTFLPNSSTINLTGSGTIFDYSSGTYTSGAETINLTDSSSSAKTFAGGGQTFYHIVFSGTGSGEFTISGNNTFNKISTENSPHTIKFTAGSTQTTKFWNVSGVPNNLITIKSTNDTSTWNLYLTPESYGNGSYQSNYLSVQDSTVSGNSMFSIIYAENSTDVSNNNGWTFAIRSRGGGVSVESSATPDPDVGGGGQGGGDNVGSQGNGSDVGGGGQGGGTGDLGFFQSLFNVRHFSKVFALASVFSIFL